MMVYKKLLHLLKTLMMLCLAVLFLPLSVSAQTEIKVKEGDHYSVYSNGNDLNVRIMNDINADVSPGAEVSANRPEDKVIVETQNVSEKAGYAGNGVNASADGEKSRTEIIVNRNVNAENKYHAIGVYPQALNGGTVNMTVRGSITAKTDESAHSLQKNINSSIQESYAGKDISADPSMKEGKQDRPDAFAIYVHTDKSSTVVNVHENVTASASGKNAETAFADAAGILVTAGNEGIVEFSIDGNVVTDVFAEGEKSAFTNTSGIGGIYLELGNKGTAAGSVGGDVTISSSARGKEKVNASTAGISIYAVEGEADISASVTGNITVASFAEGDDQIGSNASGINAEIQNNGSASVTVAGDVIANSQAKGKKTVLADATGIGVGLFDSSSVFSVKGDVISTASAIDQAVAIGISIDAESGSDAAVTVSGNVIASAVAENRIENGVIAIANDGSKASITIEGDVISDSVGVSIGAEKNSRITFAVFGTINAEKAGVQVGDNVTADNFDLTVWKIEPNSVGCVAVKTDGSCAEDVEAAIKYIIKVNGSQHNIRLTDQYGKPLEISHGVPVAKAGETVCFHSEAQSNGNCIIVSKGGSVSFTADSGDGIDFYRILDKEGKLPATGFSAHTAFPLPLRPQDLVYGKTGLTLQIPKLDVITEIVETPYIGNDYPVDWLGVDTGLPEGFPLPGTGTTVLTGHNHLNTEEMGPFALLSSLELGERIFINSQDGRSSIYEVFASEKIAENDFSSLKRLAGMEENELILMTCEDERPEGGYANRRIVATRLLP